MSEKNDRVFQLSLTEIAFLLVFLLMLLLGYMIFKLDQDLADTQQQLTTGANLAAQQEALAAARAKLKTELQSAGSQNPDEVISKLLSQAELIQEREILRAQVADLDAQVSALTKVKAVLEKVANETATRMKQQGQQVTPAAEAKLAKDLMDAYQQMNQASAAGLPQVQKENADLRGQVAFLKGKLDARGGRDYPPCWADEHTGKVEFIFDIMMSTDGLTVSPAWPKNRTADALTFTTTTQLISPKKHPLSEFIQLANPIFADSKAKNCRHYVVLRSNIADTATFNRYRYNVENMFYKVEKN